MLRRAVKQRKDSIEQYARGGRQDLVDAETEELAILEGYLPQGLTDAEIEAAIRVDRRREGHSPPRRTSASLMKELMARYTGRVDGKKAQEIARRLLP